MTKTQEPIKLAGTYGKYAGIETMREAKQALHAKDKEIADLKANARLMAAAPDMLEALKEIADCIRNGSDWFQGRGRVAKYKTAAAIAKAEGGAS